MRTQVIVADDEPHLRAHLVQLLQTLWPEHGPGELNLVGEPGDGAQALRLITERRPAIAFLDIRMPGLTGLEVARKVAMQSGHQPLLVFVTAYDDHAVEAFEAAAVDYLLKPVNQERLSQCLRRIAERLDTKTPAASDADPRLAALLDRLDGLELTGPRPPLRWLRSGQGEETELVSTDEVVYFQAGQKYVSAFTRDREHVLRLTIKELTQQLDPEQFWQVHRGLIVNVSQIVRARRDLRGRYVLTVRDRTETLRTSLAYAHLFRSM
ncbi:MAG: LytTR family DNA-binding domain-containing protein [Pseudomonadota bacterium]